MPLREPPNQNALNEGGAATQVWNDWFTRIYFLLRNTLPWQLPSFSVSDLPNASSYVGHMLYVPDATGGAVLAFSDGVNWLRSTDRTIID